MKNKKTIIGIVAKYQETIEDRYDALIRDEVKNAIVDNGGIAIGILPPKTEIDFTPANGEDNYSDNLSDKEKMDFIEQINLCDGIIFQGGKASLKYESWLAKYTFENDIPTLGICAGQNNMIRGVGGTTKSVLNPEKHNQKWVDEVHTIKIDTKSKFFKIVNCKVMTVNSRHKNTIDNPTNHYKVVAVDDEGNIEVVEAPNKRFNIAMRFHPESLYKKSPIHNAIFKSFIEECKKLMF